MGASARCLSLSIVHAVQLFKHLTVNMCVCVVYTYIGTFILQSKLYVMLVYVIAPYCIVYLLQWEKLQCISYE